MLRILFASTLSIISMLAFVKLVGNRQVSQMNLFDYISGITVGSIAADMAIELEGALWPGLLGIGVYAAAAFAIDYGSCKSYTLRRLFNGTPLILYENNRLYEKQLLHARIDVNEFLTQCRTAGYFDLSQIDTAVLETNGRISFLPKAEHRPATPADFKHSPPADKPCATLIADGRLLRANLAAAQVDEAWLLNELHQRACPLENVFLALYDVHGHLTLYPRTEQATPLQPFE